MINSVMGDNIYKNMIVNMTDAHTRETYYAYASRAAVIASMSIPKVFPVKKLTGTVFKDTTPYSYNGPMQSIKEQYFLNETEVYDGGVYNLYPFPPIEDIIKCKKLYCLCCPHTISPEEMDNGGTLHQTIYWPEPQQNGSLLGFSKDLEIYHKSYEFMKKIIDGGKL